MPILIFRRRKFGFLEFIPQNSFFQPTMKRLTLDCAPSDVSLNESVRVLEVHYSSSSARLPLDLTGSTFSAVFNLTTTPLERLLTEIEIKGPGWLDVTNYGKFLNLETEPKCYI